MPADPRIEHIVVLMLENRSFDHMLGFLDQGIKPPLSASDHVPRDPGNPGLGDAPVFWNAPDAVDIDGDPGHGFDDVMRQLFGTEAPDGGWKAPYKPKNNGFVWNYGNRAKPPKNPPKNSDDIMGCQPPVAVPVLGTLARSFAVCTRWHCSLPSETWPNRLFAHAGSSFGSVGAGRVPRFHPFAPTIFDLAHSKVYAGDVAQVYAFGPLLRMRGQIHHMLDFEHHVREGKLPAYSFIEPRHFDTEKWGLANSQHPTSELKIGPKVFRSTGSICRGESLIARVYNTLLSNEEIWMKTMLLITYDEHGSFYDRVHPPGVTPLGRPAKKEAFRFDLLGPRVPAVVVSPYVGEGVVECETVFDHTSITATVREQFGLRPALSSREGAAKTLHALLDPPSPRSSDPPDLSQYADESRCDPTIEGLGPDEIWEARMRRPLDDFQRQLVEMMRNVDEEIAVVSTEGVNTAGDAEPLVEAFVEKYHPPETEPAGGVTA